MIKNHDKNFNYMVSSYQKLSFRRKIKCFREKNMASFKKQINEIRLPKYLALYIWSRYERLKPFLKSVDPNDYLHKLNYRFQRKTAKLRLDKLLLIFLFPSVHFSRYWQSSETCKILTVIWDMQNFSSVALG